MREWSNGRVCYNLSKERRNNFSQERRQNLFEEAGPSGTKGVREEKIEMFGQSVSPSPEGVGSFEMVGKRRDREAVF